MYVNATVVSYISIWLSCTYNKSGALSVFLNFFNKMIFAFFIKLILLGVGFLNRTGEEIGY